MIRPLILAGGLFAGAALVLAAMAVEAGRLTGGGTAPGRPPQPTRFAGINLGAGGFAPSKLPGAYGVNYRYPTKGEGAPFLAEGMNAVRVPVLWERLQPTPRGELDAGELARLDQSLAQLSGYQLVILDVHNYAAYRRAKLTGPEGAALLADLWTRLARHYASEPRMAFGIMNEPNGIGAGAWRAIGEAALRAIRQTGARNLVLMPGTRWTGAASWTAGGDDSNAKVLAGLRDPANNLVFEFHQYFDANSSGTGRDCVSENEASRRLGVATAWLRANKARGFLAEFGVADNPACLATLTRVMADLDAGSDVWIGWTWWAAGDWWGKYMFNLQPAIGVNRPQMMVLRPHIAGYRRKAG